MGSSLFFRLLGPVEASVDGREVRLGGPRARAVLAVLLLSPNKVVPLDSIVNAVWGDGISESARFQAQNRMSALRRALREAGGADVIDTAGAGYVLSVKPGELDVHTFEDQVADGRRRVEESDLEGAAASISAALEIWRGPALHGLNTPRMLAAAQQLDEARVAAQELLFDIELRLGQHQRIVSAILDHCQAHPWRERPVGQLMLALYRSHRRRDALDAFERTNRLLTAELGLDPGQELVRLRDQILRDDPSLALPTETVPVAIHTDAVQVFRPAPARMLPRAVPDFVGRSFDLDLLSAALANPTTATVYTVAGPPGVGKTALSVEWAYRVADRFPDGQLFVNLRGHGAHAAVRPVEALAALLVGLGVAPDQIPPDEAAAVARYRSLLGDRRVVVVLDNAATADQVRPLLPPGAGSVAIVTSRTRLTGLHAVDGARPMGLAALSIAESVELLRRLLGAGRAAEPAEAIADLADACGHLPLALRIVAAQLAEETNRSVADLVRRLRSGDRLAALEVAGDSSTAVRVALTESYARLDPAAQRMFRLFGLVAGPDISLDAAAALIEVEAGVAATVLDSLIAAHLVERRQLDRFGMHDLLRELAGSLVTSDESEVERTAAARRLSAYLIQRANAAATQAFPSGMRLLDGPTGPAFRDRDEALAWLDVELVNLVAVAGSGAKRGSPELAPLLADALRAYFWVRRDYVRWGDIARAALTAATDSGDQRGQAAAAFSVGMSELNVSHYADAIGYLRQTREIARSIGWREAEASAVGNLGIAYSELGDITRAIESYRQAYLVNEELGRTVGRANNLGNLGLLQIRIGQFRPAADHLAEAVAVHRQVGSGPNLSVFLHGLGQAERILGRLAEAEAHLNEALAVVRELEDVDQEVIIFDDLAAIHLDRGDLVRARECGETAYRLAADVEDPDVHSLALVTRAMTASAAGAHEPAMAAAAEAVEAAAVSGGAHGWIVAMTASATAHLGADMADRADQEAMQAVERARESGFRSLEGLAINVRAEAALVRGDHPAALEFAQAAMSIHRETGHAMAAARASALADRALSFS